MKTALKEKSYTPPIKQYNFKHPHENEGTDPVTMLYRARLSSYLKSLEKRLQKDQK